MSKYRQMIKEMEPNDEAIKKGLLQQFNEDKSKMNSYWSELEEKENNFRHYKKIKKATQDQCQEAAVDIVGDVRDIARGNRATKPAVSSTSVAVPPPQVEPEPYSHSTIATSLNDNGMKTQKNSLPYKSRLAHLLPMSATGPSISIVPQKRDHTREDDHPRPHMPRKSSASSTSNHVSDSSLIAEPWRSLINSVLQKMHGLPVADLQEWPNKLDGHHELLYNYILQQSRKSQRTKLEEKDLLVAMSGIINSRMEGSNEIFGEDIVNSINKSCLLPQAHMPSVELELILEPLRIAFKAGGESGLLDQIEEFIGDDARARKAKNETSQLRAQVLDIIRYLIKRPPRNVKSEGELVACWEYVINGLSGNRLELRTGELTSKATAWQRKLLQTEFNLEPGTANYGRKLDMQCRSGNHELNNSEFKASHIPDAQVELQYRKNIRINQSMMLYLQQTIGMPLNDLQVLGLDIHESPAGISRASIDASD
ncbi:hypothetical protein BGZ79_001820 [Entomortierella chlamydospora]|nr:hypothetical protein BGZ79_001820 [Entomortierella chlamydospora]